MYIGAEKILICVFSKLDSKILYKKESKFLEFNDHIDENKIIIDARVPNQIILYD